MNSSKIGTIARFEFITTLQRRSVLFVLFGMPILSLLFLVGVNWLASDSRGATGEQDGDGDRTTLLRDFAFGEQPAQSLPAGLVDHTGQISQYPHPTNLYFQPQSSEGAAQTAYNDGHLSGYYVIPADYLETGQVFFYARTFSFADVGRNLLVNLLAANFIDDPILLARATTSPSIQEVRLNVREEDEVDFDGTAVILGIGLAMLFYMTAIGAAGYLLHSLGKEKQNRVMEILLSSCRPFDLLAGKMVGLGGIGLLQITIWTGLGLLIFGRGNGLFGNVVLPALEPHIWFIIAAHFMVGYLVYASMFAGLGAIAPGPKESSQYTFFFMLPTFIPLWFSGILLTSPGGKLAVSLSLFPLTSPIAMPMRLAVSTVPAGQWMLSLGLGLLTAVFTLFLATRIFRSQALLSGQSMTPGAIWQMFRK